MLNELLYFSIYKRVKLRLLLCLYYLLKFYSLLSNTSKANAQSEEIDMCLHCNKPSNVFNRSRFRNLCIKNGAFTFRFTLLFVTSFKIKKLNKKNY